MTSNSQPVRSSNRKRQSKKNPSLSTGSLKGLLIVGSAAATYFGANMIAQVEMLQMTETAVAPSQIIIKQPVVSQPVVTDPNQPSDNTPILINPEPIPQVIIPEPVTSSRSSR